MTIDDKPEKPAIRQPRVFAAPPPAPPPPPPPEDGDDETIPHLAERRRFSWGGLFWSATGGLISMAIGYSAYRFVEDLFAREDWLGWLALGLACAAGVAAAVIIIREIWALFRLEKIGEIRAIADRAFRHDSAPDAKATSDNLRALYRSRPDMANALTLLSQHDSQIMDPRDRLKLMERLLMQELDRDAARLIARSARRVSIVTAVLPTAYLDVLVVASQNMMMLRGLASLYGVRPHLFGTMKLARMVVTHLAVTGSIAFTDALMQQFIGRGLVGRVSARVGEGAINGIMTARIGLAAMDVVRPLPFRSLRKPSLSSIASRIGERAAKDIDEDNPPA